MRISHFFWSLSAPIDKLVGAHHLGPVLRAQFKKEQIHSLVQTMPILAAGAVVTSFLLLVLTAGTQVFHLVIVWAGGLHAVQFFCMAVWLGSRKDAAAWAALADSARVVALAALVQGLFWGILPILLLPGAEAALKLTVEITVVGVLAASCFALAIFPQAALALGLPVLGGALWAASMLDNAAEANVLVVLLLTCSSIAAMMSTGLVRKVVRHLFAELRVREQGNIISLLLKEFEENSGDWLWELDCDGRIVRPSQRFAAAAGCQAEELSGEGFCDFFRRKCNDGELLAAELERHIARRMTFQGIEATIKHAGEQRWWRLTGKPAFDEADHYVGYIGTASDITAEKNAERRINFLAHHDALTGLSNRAKFTEHLKHCVARLERYGCPFSVFYLDLDQFKSVNDSRGHMAGDKLLIQVGQRIHAQLRETDFAARLGGDEFAIIVTSHCGAQDAAALALRLIAAVSEPYDVDGETVSIGVSVGIAMAPKNGTRPDQILRNADLALYRAKADGRGVYRFFEIQMDAEARERRMLEVELREALKAGEFVLHYQPLVSADDNKPSGFEALIRWNHPIRGMVQPAEFITIAEQIGVIREIGDWTIREACMAASRWPNELLVAVNLSAKHFEASDIAAVVRDALAQSGLSPSRLELEITESLLIECPDEVLAKLTDLKTLGVTVAMDDFGTGYSSLSYLLKFPFDKIKIDKSFVAALTEDAVARDILRSIASLGKTLRMHITAEGVETQTQAEFLRKIACTQLQGYYFAKPLSELDLANYLLTHFAKTVSFAGGRGRRLTKPVSKRAG